MPDSTSHSQANMTAINIQDVLTRQDYAHFNTFKILSFRGNMILEKTHIKVITRIFMFETLHLYSYKNQHYKWNDLYHSFMN